MDILLKNQISNATILYKKSLNCNPNHVGQILLFGFICYSGKQGLKIGKLPIYKFFLDASHLYYHLGICPDKLILTKHQPIFDNSINDSNFDDAYKYYNLDYGLRLKQSDTLTIKKSWLTHEFLHLLTGAPKSFDGDTFIASLSRFLNIDNSFSGVHSYCIWEDFKIIGNYRRDLASAKHPYLGKIYDEVIFRLNCKNLILEFVTKSIESINNGKTLDISSVMEMRETFQVCYDTISEDVFNKFSTNSH